MRISKERGKRTPRSFFRGRALSQVRLSFIPGPRLSRLLSSLPSADEPQMCLKCICCAVKSPFVPQVALKCILKSDPERIRATFPFEMHEKLHRQGQKWPSEGRNLCAIDTFQREMWQSASASNPPQNTSGPATMTGPPRKDAARTQYPESATCGMRLIAAFLPIAELNARDRVPELFRGFRFSLACNRTYC